MTPVYFKGENTEILHLGNNRLTYIVGHYPLQDYPTGCIAEPDVD